MCAVVAACEHPSGGSAEVPRDGGRAGLEVDAERPSGGALPDAYVSIPDRAWPDAAPLDASALVDGGRRDAARGDGEAGVPEPDATELDAAEPDGAQPDDAQPDGAQPDVEPDGARPDGAQPDAAEPDAAEPDAAEPDAAEPDAAEPDAAEPDAAEPDASEPDAAMPDAATPDAARPDAARNAAPELSTLSVEPGSPLLDDPLRAVGRFDDPDGDDVALVDCQWQRREGAGWVDLPGETGEALAACADRPGCAAGASLRVRCRASDGDAESAAVDSAPVTIGCGARDPRCQPSPHGAAPTVDPLDYGYGYWPTNHRSADGGYERVMHFLTGHYGLLFDEETGEVPAFGWLDDRLPASAARRRPNADLERLPAATLTFEAGPAEAPAVVSGFRAGEGPRDDRALLRDGGRFVQFVELPHVDYANAPAPLTGRVEIASLPRHVVFNHTVDDPRARVRLGGAFLDGLGAEWLVPDRALRMADDDGRGWLFVVYGGNTLAIDGGAVVAEDIAAGAGAHTASLLAAPLTALGAAEVSMYLQPGVAVGVTYTLLDPLGAPAAPSRAVPWDPRLGAYRADLGTLAAAGLTGSLDYDERPELHNWYGRHRLAVEPRGASPVAVPLAFFGTGGASLSMTGGAASLRDEGGEPVGVPLQISKNWHDAVLGAWYHLYTQPTFGPGEPRALELTLASSRWGAGAYAASHAQLSLIGYSDAGGRWDESALGAFGESITYDPDLALGRAMVDDVRPFLVQADERWSWTGNVGGADFLRYRAADEPGLIRRLGRVRSTYHAPGPNLTDVEYSGVTSDGRIEANLRVQLGRTDDMVRAWYHLEYTFHEDVRYDRLAFFQMAADRYGDNDFAHVAWGSADGVVEDREILDHRATGYADVAERGIPLVGPSPWVMLYDNRRLDGAPPEHFADVAYVVRDFEARIGGQVVEVPHLSLNRTFNRYSQYGLELGLPYEPDAVIPAGSVVRATVEYLVPPADKAVYYGASDWLASLPADAWRTPAMAVRLASGGALAVDAAVGAVRRVHPVEVDAEAASVAAEVTLSGGLGYVPITFHGLPRHDGWRLEVASGPVWTPLDQSVHGNDYWQASRDDATGTWSLTFNVPNGGERRYRLVWAGHVGREQGPFAAERGAVRALGEVAGAPTLRADDTTPALAEVAPGESRGVYFDGLDYAGSATRVFAWLGLPGGASADAPVPGVVLVHGGGGTAFREWVDRWTARGYAAISIAVEGQTDIEATPGEQEAGLAVGRWLRHRMPGPQRVGAYGDSDLPLEEQWIYHAVADTTLAGALLRSLPEVDEGAVGLMGVSWGGVVAATVIGVEPRFAFAVPVYGGGHKYDIPNYFGAALGDDAIYRQVWDPVLRMGAVTAPTLWLSWPDEDNFSLDSQAATYLAAPGPRMVSLVPGLGHGHAAAWDRPESYAFAEAVLATGAPWASQVSVGEVEGVAEGVFRSTRPLVAASLVYATGSGHTGDLEWAERPADAFVEGPAGTWTARAALPAATTAWFVNALAPDGDGALVLSSDYQERIALAVEPADGLEFGHPVGVERSVGRLQVGFTGPSYVEVVAVTVEEETHPGAFSVSAALPWVLEQPLPATEALELLFDDAVAQLGEGEVASCVLRIVWAALDGRTTAVDVPARVGLVPNVPIVFAGDADWSSQDVFFDADVTITGGAQVRLDRDAQVRSLVVDDGTLVVPAELNLVVSGAFEIRDGGALVVTGGRVDLEADPIVVDGLLVVDGGEVFRDMAGVRGRVAGEGRVEVLDGRFAFSGGAAPDILVIDVDLHVSGGAVELSGQVYLGQVTPTLFEVLGSASEVSVLALNTLGGRRGTWRFVLDEGGVSPVGVRAWMNLTHARIEVDGSAYAGGARVLSLLDAANLVAVADPGNLSVVGFEENGHRAEVVQGQAGGRGGAELVVVELP